MKKWLSLLLCAMLLALPCLQASAETLTGEADGFGGPVKAEVTVENGVITGLTLTGDAETPAIGGAALEPLTAAILAAGTVDGVDAVSGATWTSNGVFAAVKKALGIEEAAAEAAVSEASASGLSHGIGIAATPRLGPGKDDKGMPVYSFNVVVAYVVADGNGRIVDLETDIVEIITPNHDEKEDNVLAGWPGMSWNNDADCDGAVDGVLTETEESFSADLAAWKTKREKGSAYKLNSGTWESEMDLLEEAFKGKNRDELEAWVAKFTSDLNGRPLHGTSAKDEDIAKWNTLTDDEKAEMDAISSATMSVNDAHGNMIAAVGNALGALKPVNTDADIASLGLGILTTPRLGPGKDDQDVPVYSFNVVAAGSVYDAEGRTAGLCCDILEIITPNHDGADDNVFAGWPSQSYNNDADADGKVDGVLEQTEESFVAAVNGYTSKRALGTKYKMNSGTWVQEMSIFEAGFEGKTADEILAFFALHGSASNGRLVTAASTRDADAAAWAALTAEQQREVDAFSGATMSLNDAHGNIIGAIGKAWKAAKPSVIHINK